MSQPSLPPPDDLPTDVPTLHAMVRELQASVTLLQEQVRLLTEQVERLNRKPPDSRHSHRPPSSDPPWRERPQAPPSGRKRGGQKGHPGKHRHLLPAEQVDRRVVVAPEACGHCGAVFPPPVRTRRLKVRRHQVAELPPLRPVVTEYQLQARRCGRCHRRTWAELPRGVGRRCVGPRVQAVAALLSGGCRLSRRQVRDLLSDLFGVSLSLGTLVALERDTTRALTAPYQEVAEAVPKAAVLGVDETSWREAGVLHWLWTAVTRRFAFYRLDRHRSRAAFESLMAGEERTADAERREPVVLTDRFSAYAHLPAGRRSYCWAHLCRDFRAAAERGGVDGAVGTWVLERMGRVLAPWHRFQAGELGWEACGRECRAAGEALRAPLEWGREQGSAPLRALCRDLLEHWEALWAWLTVEGGEPTNNAAERALRSAVLWRKGSFGHQSDDGEAFVERMLTVVGTLRLQQRNLWEYLVQACQAAATGTAAPALLIQASP